MPEVLLSFVTALLISFLAIPVIINLSKKKHLFDEPNHRTAHKKRIPTLGGIAIFAAILIAVVFWTPPGYMRDLQFVLAPLLLLFIIGAKDDIDPVRPGFKFLVQLVAAALLVFLADIRITTLYSIFGVGELNYWLSITLSIFIIIAIINAFNFIDGVNGLAASIVLLSTLIYGAWFFMIERSDLIVLSAAVSGSVFGFLYYNFSPAKIFMGDTGSLILGMLAAIFSIQFVELNKLLTSSELYVESAPAMAIAVLIVPIMDSCRVMVIRLFSGRSPFKPDRKHIHHVLLDIGLSHTQTVFLLVAINLLFIIAVYLLRSLGNLNLFYIIFLTAVVLNLLLNYLRRIKLGKN